MRDTKTPAMALIENWRLSDDVEPEFCMLFERIRPWKIAVTDSGQWIYSETLRALRPNHVRCMVRIEVLKLWPKLRGKRANRVADLFIAEINEGVRKYLEHRPENRCGKIVEIEDEYERPVPYRYCDPAV